MNPITRFRENPRWVTVALGCALGIFAVPVAPTPLGSLVLMGPLGVVGLDKQVHAAGYAGPGFAFASVVCARGRGEVTMVVLAVDVFEVGIELVQAVLPYRSLGAADAGTNLAGVVFGGVVWITAVRVADARG